VRIIAATNRALAREVTAGRFRQDLYYRLAVVIVRIPPLRTRLEDLRLLIDHIQDELERRRAAAGLPKYGRLDETAITMLMRYDFPGNVRELRNIVERWAVLGATGAPGDPGALAVPEDGRAAALGSSGAAATSGAGAGPGHTKDAASPSPSGIDAALLRLPYHEAKDVWAERFERAYAEAILKESRGNVSKAARDAGIDRRHLQRLMARFGLKASE
jgi:DNA-binding NtrC family response regulator